MFRSFLKSIDNKTHINFEWVKKINGLIRVIICDSNSHRAFVVVYYEKQREYTVIAFDPRTGEFYWTKNVVNGGYGAPAITNDLIVVPSHFTNIVALSKEDGREMWQLKTAWRVRSPINVIKNKIYFSSGGVLFEVTSEGQITNQWEYPGAFFYGAVDVCQELIISLGTIEDKSGNSIESVFAFHKTGGIAYVLPLCDSPIMSSDTSGIVWQENQGFVGGNHIITSFRGIDGQPLWTTSVNGLAGRQACSIDSDRVYYTTQAGVVGALNIEDGSPAWSIHTNDKTIGSPISIAGDTIIVLADAHMNILKSNNGQLVQKIPVGHSPYGMLSLNGEYGLLGAGEPPHHGLLFAFKLANSMKKDKYLCRAEVSNAFIESEFMDILVHVDHAEHEIISLQLDGAIFGLHERVLGEIIGDSTFAFRVSIPKTMNSGNFVIPVYLTISSGDSLTRPICIRLETNNPLPSQAYLHHIQDIKQEKPTYSGAAIGVAIKSMYGNCNSSQSDLREMVDFSLGRSRYESFQIWRIILRRILTSRANKKEQLPEFHQNSLG